MTLLLVQRERAALRDETAGQLADTARLNGAQLQKAIDELRKDAVFLSRTPSVQGIVRAGRHRRDPFEGGSIAQWEERLAGLFSAYVETHPEYIRLRLIGVADNGREVVRVDRHEGRAVVVAKDRLQQQADRDYFRSAVELRSGEVDISEIDVNRTTGAVETPPTPTIRASTPVFAPDGRIFGLLAISMEVREMFDNLRAGKPSGIHAFLSDMNGDYLLHPDAGRAFGIDRGHRYRWQDEMPQLRLGPNPAPLHPPEVQTLAVSGGTVQAVAEPVHFDPLRPERYLTLIYTLPEAAIAQRLERTRTAVTVAVAASAGLLLVLLLGLTRRTFAPLDQLRQAADAIAHGRYDTPIPAAGTGYLGALADAFRTMQSGVAEREGRLHESEQAMAAYRDNLEQQVKARTAELTQARARAQLILDSSADGLFGMDMRGCFTFVNPAACAMLGYRPDQLVGRSIHATVHYSRADGTPYPVADCPMQNALRAGTVIRDDGDVFWRADGRPVPIAYAIRPMIENGATIGAVGSFSDISARQVAAQELERARSHLQTILDHMPAMIGYWDTRLCNVFGNHAFLKFFGLSAVQLHGRHLRKVVGDELFAAYRPHLDGVLNGQPQQFERKVADRAGWIRHTQAIFIPDGDEGAAKGFFTFVMDISKLKEAESAAALASRIKSDFVANMSHEIRTPLNAVLGLAQVGARMSGGRQTHDTFLRILDAGNLLLGIVNGILDFSKIESGKLEIERVRFDLGDVIDNAVKMTAIRAYAKGLDFCIEEEPGLAATWIGDPLRLSQILINLLANAIKFTERGAITLSVRRERSMLVFRVADTGIGMSAKQIARLFNPFEQAESSTTRRFGGTGLGLAICKRLVDLMDGTLDVDSRPGRGTAFELHLPLTSHDETPAPAVGSIILAGLPETEGRSLADTLAARGSTVAILPVADALARAADLVVMACDPQDERRMTAIEAIAAAGRKLALACTPGTCAFFAPGVCGHAAVSASGKTCAIVERPLRAQHLLAVLEERQEGQTDLHRGPRLTGVRVLAAEDNDTNRLVLEHILAQEGACLHCEADGQAALERLTVDGTSAYDVMITDIQMPGIDGYEVAQRAKALAPTLPVIGLTAHAMPTERQRCLAAGMVEHLAKPIDIDALVAAIRRHTGAANASSLAVCRQTAARHFGNGLVDWTALALRFGGKIGFLCKLARTVLNTHGDSPAKLRTAAAQRDFATLASLAHALKGTCGSLMAHDASELAKAAEASARQEQEVSIQRAEQLAQTLEKLLAEIAAYANNNGDIPCPIEP